MDGELFSLCQQCGCSAGDAYGMAHFARFHELVEPAVCAEMAWQRRGYLHAVWAVDNFDSWFTLAPAGTARYDRQLALITEERDRFAARVRRTFGTLEVAA